VRVEIGETIDLGDVEAFSPAEIHGTIVLAGGLSPSGIVLATGNADFADDEKSQTTDVRGSFFFKGLSEGTHSLWIEEKHGVLLADRPVEVVLARGEIRELRLDLSDRIPSELEVHVLVGGRRAEGVRLSITPERGFGRGEEVGVTNASGIVVGHVAGRGAVTLNARGHIGLLVGRSEESVTLRAGERQRVDLAFDPGRLIVAISAEAAETDNGGNPPGFYLLQVDRIGEETPTQTAHTLPNGWKEVYGKQHTDLGWIAPGSYTLSLYVGSRRLSGHVEVTPGAEATCTLTE
jgi:hypothetical protein